MWITALTNRQPIQVVLVHPEHTEIGVVCQRVNGRWEPLFGVRDTGKFQLHSCFTLSESATNALDRFMEIQGL